MEVSFKSATPPNCQGLCRNEAFSNCSSDTKGTLLQGWMCMGKDSWNEPELELSLGCHFGEENIPPQS